MPTADVPPPAARLRFALERRLLLARLALLWERAWPALWPAVGIAGAFVALALFDLPARLPSLLHAALLAVFAALLIAAAIHAFRIFRLPDRDAARRRLETASGLTHRPLAASRTGCSAAATIRHRRRCGRSIAPAWRKKPAVSASVRPWRGCCAAILTRSARRWAWRCSSARSTPGTGPTGSGGA